MSEWTKQVFLEPSDQLLLLLLLLLILILLVLLLFIYLFICQAHLQLWGINYSENNHPPIAIYLSLCFTLLYITAVLLSISYLTTETEQDPVLDISYLTV